jgi:hypothetical protein
MINKIALFCLLIGIAYGYTDLTESVKIGPKFVTVCKTNACTYFTSSSSSSEIRKTIQKALDYVEQNGGGVVLLKQNTYLVDQNIYVGSKTWFKGEGMDKTIIKLKDYAPVWIWGTSKRSGLIRAQAKDSMKISDMTINGNKAKQNTDEDSEYGKYGLFTEGCTNVWFDRVKVINWQGYGFDPHGWKKNGIWGQNLTLTNCVAEENDWDGFTLDQTLHINVINCTATFNGRHGYNVVTGSKYVYMENCEAFNNGYYYYLGTKGCGVCIQNNQLFGTSDVEFHGSHVYRSNKAAFCLNDVYNLNIHHNLVDQSCNCHTFTSTRGSRIENNVCVAKQFNSSPVNTILVTDDDGLYTGPMDTIVYLKDNTFTKITCTAFQTPDTVVNAEMAAKNLPRKESIETGLPEEDELLLALAEYRDSHQTVVVSGASNVRPGFAVVALIALKKLMF